MGKQPRRFGRNVRLTALGLAVSLASSVLAGCARDTGRTYNQQPPGPDVRGSRSTYPPQPRGVQKGMSAGQKVALLVGAAALYYMYNKHKNKQGTGAEGKYYLSKNGRVYYREPNGNYHWVSPPREGIRVPESEASAYREYAGYDRSTTGKSFGGYGASATAPVGGPPGPRGF